MSKAFGHNFILINDIEQIMPPNIFGGGPWLHIATVIRGLKEYCCFKHAKTGSIFIEEVDPTEPTLFKKIQSDSEFEDISSFLKSKNLLVIGIDKEFKVAR